MVGKGEPHPLQVKVQGQMSFCYVSFFNSGLVISASIEPLVLPPLAGSLNLDDIMKVLYQCLVICQLNLICCMPCMMHG